LVIIVELFLLVLSYICAQIYFCC